MTPPIVPPCAAMPTPANPSRRGRDVTRRRWAILAWVMAALSLAAWGAWCFSHAVEWSTFTAGPVRAVAPRGAGSPVVPAPGLTMIEERDETHVMFGRGGVFVYSFSPYTQSFAAPNADANSRNLAWATMDTMFPVFPPWRFQRFRSGPVWGVRLWAFAALPSALLALCLLARRRVAPEGVCPRCRYSLAGLTAGAACPECGSGVGVWLGGEGKTSGTRPGPG